jgi:hypothetical protein
VVKIDLVVGSTGCHISVYREYDNAQNYLCVKDFLQKYIIKSSRVLTRT